MFVLMRIMATGTVHRVGFGVTLALDQTRMLIRSVNATAIRRHFEKFFVVADFIARTKRKRWLQVNAVTTGMTLTADVVHSLARQIVRMQNELRGFRFRIGAMIVHVFFGGSVATFAGHAENHF